MWSSDVPEEASAHGLIEELVSLKIEDEGCLFDLAPLTMLIVGKDRIVDCTEAYNRLHQPFWRQTEQ